MFKNDYLEIFAEQLSSEHTFRVLFQDNKYIDVSFFLN